MLPDSGKVQDRRRLQRGSAAAPGRAAGYAAAVVRSDRHVEKIRRQFTRQADAYAQMPQTRDERGLQALVALAGASGSDRVVDVACGPGFLTMAFAAKCEHALGVDATQALLDAARREAIRRGIDNVAFVLGDASRLLLPDRSFDVASCRAAFHHFPDPGVVLREMRRVVQPGGRILIADMLTSADPEKAAYQDRIEKLCDPTHVRALTGTGFEALFGDAGLEVLHRPTSEIHYDVEEWLLHGGPTDEAAGEIRGLFEASLDRDRSGLKVRREHGRLRFTHQAAAFVLRVPTA